MNKSILFILITYTNQYNQQTLYQRSLLAVFDVQFTNAFTSFNALLLAFCYYKFLIKIFQHEFIFTCVQFAYYFIQFQVFAYRIDEILNLKRTLILIVFIRLNFIFTRLFYTSGFIVDYKHLYSYMDIFNSVNI